MFPAQGVVVYLAQGAVVHPAQGVVVHPARGAVVHPAQGAVVDPVRGAVVHLARGAVVNFVRGTVRSLHAPHNSVCSENRIVAGAGKRLRFKYFGLLRNSMPQTDGLRADNIYEPA